jgi:hypothetical protein
LCAESDLSVGNNAALWRPNYAIRMDVKRLAKDWCPPVVWRSLRRHVFLGLRDWEYVGAHWPEMDKRADGWDDPSAAAALVANWRRYSEQAAGTGPGPSIPGTRQEPIRMPTINWSLSPIAWPWQAAAGSDCPFSTGAAPSAISR